MDHEISILKKVEEIELTVRAHNVLRNNNFKTVKEIIDFGVDKIRAFPNAGKKTVEEIKQAIKPYLQEAEAQRAKYDSRNLQSYLTADNEIYFHAPISELNLSIRAINALSKMRAKNIKDVVRILNSKLIDLLRMKNVGRMTVDEIKSAIENYISRELQVTNIRMTFAQVIENLFLSINPRYQFAIKARFGYEDGTVWTLEKVSKKIGVTRERVRQIIRKELLLLKSYRSKKALQVLIENVERLLLLNRGIISINDIVKDAFFEAGTDNQFIFLFGFIAELYQERYKLIDEIFLSSLTDDELATLHSKIHEITLNCRFPIDKEDLMQNILLILGNMSKDYLNHYLVDGVRVEMSDGNVLSPGKLSIPKKIKLLLKDIDRPMHFSEIAELFKKHFGDTKLRASDLEHAIHARVSDSGEFIIVGPGTFIKKEKFERPANLQEVVRKSREIIRKLKNITDTRYLLNELRKQNVDVSTLNPYTLRAILLEYPDFVRYKKFEIGLEEYADQFERKSQSDLLCDIIVSSARPMHVKEIWKEISKQRGLPLYAVDQRLSKDTRFIKVSPSTYTVAANIKAYEDKRKIITNFTEEWISLKGTAVSAFLVYEALRQTDQIKDISIGFVEHVLESRGQFVKLSNRFYDLAGRSSL